MNIPEKVKTQLKKPLGSLHKDFKGIMKLSGSHRIIAIGDVCTLGLLAMGIRPHLAVFDFKYMRKELDEEMKNILQLYYKKRQTYKNPAGTLSEKLLDDAEKLIRNGGGLFIDGEEDLTALAFILKAGKNDIIVYGQPNMGMVIVKPDAKTKKKIEKWLSAASLGHEVKRNKSK